MVKERVSDRDNSIISSCTQCENFTGSSIGIGQCLHIVGPNKFEIPVYQYFKPKGYVVPIPDSCPLDLYKDQTIDSNGIGSIASGNNMTDTTQVPKYSNFNEWAKAQMALNNNVSVSFSDKQESIDNTEDRYSRLFNEVYKRALKSKKHDSQELEINELGGKQSKLKERFDYLPPNAVSSCARTIGYGESKYGEGNWKKISILSHINHALAHLFKYLAKDKSEDHLAHATSRLLFALEMEILLKN